MFKLLILGTLFYFLYRLVLRPTLIEPGERKINIDKRAKKDNGNQYSEDDYIDYEEVE